MLVMKFGGTSVGDARRVRASARIALTRPGPNVLVVSACGGVTNLLLDAGRAAERGDRDAVAASVAEIHARHANVLPVLRTTALGETTRRKALVRKTRSSGAWATAYTPCTTRLTSPRPTSRRSWARETPSSPA